jgi:hypothetical protein
LVISTNHEVPYYAVSLGPNVSLSTLFSNTISLCSSETALQFTATGSGDEPCCICALHIMTNAAMLANISLCCDANINVLELFR